MVDWVWCLLYVYWKQFETTILELLKESENMDLQIARNWWKLKTDKKPKPVGVDRQKTVEPFARDDGFDKATSSCHTHMAYSA